MPDRIPAFGQADLTNCDREPIQRPGSIQPHGVLLALSPEDHVVRHVAGPTQRLFGIAAWALLGRGIEVLPAGLAAVVPGLAVDVRGRATGSRRILLDGIPCDAIAHRAGEYLLIEVEPLLEPDLEEPLATAEEMLHRIRLAEGLAGFCQAMADEVRNLTGFDRVMVYRFHPDESGEVVAEARNPAVGSFLGLRYPAADIPHQARELYLRNWVRIIPDIAYTPAPIQAEAADAAPLDLSFGVLRSVSPIHVEYLRNMGVAASMSLSLIVGGRLWGLIACHHDTPRYLPYRVRLTGETFALVASARIEGLLGAAALAAQRQAASVRIGLMGQLGHATDLGAGLTRHQPNLLDYIAADGVGVWTDGRFTGLGTTPAPDRVAMLVAWLNERGGRDEVFHTDRLSLDCPALRTDADRASGLLALSISRRPRDYVLWFRRELPRVVVWAGNPGKVMVQTAGGPRLSPRRSFAAWRESVRLQSAPWERHEIEAARALRVSLIDVVLQRIEAVAGEREAAHREQEKLSRELDRRVAELEALTVALRAETRRRAEAEDALSRALRRTVGLQEEERRQIARDLHDGAGQTLTLIQFGLERVGRVVTTDAAAAEVAALRTLAGELGAELARMARDLGPPALDGLGLEAALRQLVEEVGRAQGLSVEIACDPGLPRPLPEVETVLYRVAQEALANVLRHAGATRAWVRLAPDGQALRLVVEDDGRGFDPAEVATRQPRGAHRGLMGMRERVARVGGTIAIGPREGGGTRVAVTADG